MPKAKALRPDVPVIMITAYGDVETKRKALEGGAEGRATFRSEDEWRLGVLLALKAPQSP